jgi:hypothetical protein
MLHDALGATDDLQTFWVNFFIAGLMLHYEAFITCGEHQAAVSSSSPCRLPNLALALESAALMSH